MRHYMVSVFYTDLISRSKQTLVALAVNKAKLLLTFNGVHYLFIYIFCQTLLVFTLI